MSIRSISFWVLTLILSVGTALAASPTRTSFADNEQSSFLNLPGRWIHGSYGNHFGAREFYLYVPKSAAKSSNDKSVPLVVMLHGCTQTAFQSAAESGLNDIAEKYGFAVLYPQQSQQDNILECWNWFLPQNEKRDSGELSIIMGMVDLVSSKIQVNPNHVYIAGFSAGAALASNLLACYSDRFAGGLIASGLEYKAATSEVEANQVMRTGSTHDIKKSGIEAAHCTGQGGKVAAVMIVHGSDDPIVDPINSTHVLQQFTQMNDILDDGIDNDSQTTDRITSRELKAPGGERYRMDFYGGRDAIHILNVTVYGMGHAWSGAHQSGIYADPSGPDVGNMMWLFLSQYSRNARN